jgi:hypothetical protein
MTWDEVLADREGWTYERNRIGGADAPFAADHLLSQRFAGVLVDTDEINAPQEIMQILLVTLWIGGAIDPFGELGQLRTAAK